MSLIAPKKVRHELGDTWDYGIPYKRKNSPDGLAVAWNKSAALAAGVAAVDAPFHLAVDWHKNSVTITELTSARADRMLNGNWHLYGGTAADVVALVEYMRTGPVGYHKLGCSYVVKSDGSIYVHAPEADVDALD